MVTGAGGNIGTPLRKHLAFLSRSATIVIASRKRDSLRVGEVWFDFADPSSHKALDGVHTLFLLRPPELADVPRVFVPLIRNAEAAGVRHVVFLSVQGADVHTFIPHAQIEAALAASPCLTHTFLRPSYFMSNFTSMFLADIVGPRHEVVVPAGSALFNPVDPSDVAEVAAHVLLNPSAYKNVAFDITGTEQLSFKDMAALLSTSCNIPVTFSSPWVLPFIWRQWRRGVPLSFAVIVAALHAGPRYEAVPQLSSAVERITGHAPQTFAGFCMANRALFSPAC